MMSQMDARSRARAAVADGLDRVTGAVARRTAAAGEDLSDIDLLVTDQLRRADGELVDPPAWAAFLRRALRHQHHEVEELLAPDGDRDERVLRLTTLLDELRGAVPPLPSTLARRLADAGDALRGNRTPFVRPTYVGDVGHHAAMASSGAAQARFLAAVVRFMAARRIIEIGTAYGLGTLTLAATAGPDASIVTAERSEPQLSLATKLLEEENTVTVLGGIAAENTAPVTDALGGQADMLFHDGAHSREAYVEDFAAYESLLAPGAVVVFDDINWEDDRWHPDANTYAGWQEVSGHARVRAAYEVDATWGILLLR